MLTRMVEPAGAIMLIPLAVSSLSPLPSTLFPLNINMLRAGSVPTRNMVPKLLTMVPLTGNAARLRDSCASDCSAPSKSMGVPTRGWPGTPLLLVIVYLMTVPVGNMTVFPAKLVPPVISIFPRTMRSALVVDTGSLSPIP